MPHELKIKITPFEKKYGLPISVIHLKDKRSIKNADRP
jgi:hypothetical protein